MFTVLFVGMTYSVYKEPLVYITAIRVLEIVQYTFCKSPLEVVVVISICVLLIYCLYFDFVVLHYGPFTVLSFAETNIWYFVACHTSSNIQVLYIFYYVTLVLPTFCCRLAALIVDNNMYACLV